MGGMGKKGRAISPFRLLVKLRVENEEYFNALWPIYCHFLCKYETRLVSLLLDRDTKQLLSVMYWIQDKKRKRGDEDLERCSFSLLQSFHFCPLFVASVYFSYQFYYF